ncbi:hypothetical protein DEU56DRAFT_770793 [Suillus clintonianus]|uniref:uncharacterized protein n=1 Tax=Suillus clintonianus TaxID=1904413 RepID=UPI001B876447|nr:uncharacterized protein DEU56DRAFT_770793 [Suillus clintonianus]KAG2154853.1 hypothetical protein DEU56DRAFT_770793 [Suillus clintonianus]
MRDFVHHFYFDPVTKKLIDEAVAFNNQAHVLSRQGDYAGSERLHLRALDIKLSAVGENDVTAVTRNELGEVYIKMGRIADAEEQLRKAVSVRLRTGPAYDAAVSLENLGQVYEAKGNFEEARKVRRSHPGNIMVCGNNKCPGKTFHQSQLLACSGCKSAFYCGKACQAKDWRARHKKLCKAYTNTDH